MNDFLRTPYLKRLFFGVTLIAFVLLLIVRFFVLPSLSKQPLPAFQDVIVSVVDNLLVAVVTTVVGALVIIWATPPVTTKSHLEIIDPVQIKQALDEAHKNTDLWWYKGNTARHLRSVTIPLMAKSSQQTNLSKIINILILDPTNQAACEYYAIHRQRLRSAIKDNPWTPERVKLELNATILAAYWFKTQIPSLEFNIGLLDKVSIFRVDLSSNLLIVTKEGKEEPAFRCDSGTFFYNSFKEELVITLKQSKRLPVDIKSKIPNKLTPENVRQLLEEIELSNQDLSDSNLEKIITLIERQENPYA